MAEVISVDLPMTFRKRGGRKVIVLPDGTQGNPMPMATIDNTVIKAVMPSAMPSIEVREMKEMK